MRGLFQAAGWGGKRRNRGTERGQDSAFFATQSRADAHVVDVPTTDQHAAGLGTGLHRGAHHPTIVTRTAVVNFAHSATAKLAAS
jgi:hypothetical protein